MAAAAAPVDTAKWLREQLLQQVATSNIFTHIVNRFCSGEAAKDLAKTVYAAHCKGTLVPDISKVLRWTEAARANGSRAPLVVIAGQAPYPSRRHANGLCFDVDDGVDVPGSAARLNGLAQRVSTPLHMGETASPHTLVTRRWLIQGAVLVNAKLTTEEGERKGHSGWEGLVINLLNAMLFSSSLEQRVTAFVAFGRDASELSRHVKAKAPEGASFYVVEGPHPSAANRGGGGGDRYSRYGGGDEADGPSQTQQLFEAARSYHPSCTFDGFELVNAFLMDKCNAVFTWGLTVPVRQ